MKSLIFLIFLEFVFSTVSFGQDCTEAINSETQKKVQELISKDDNNILGLQFHITTLKMALEVEKSELKTLEGYLKKKEKLLKDSPVINDLVRSYKAFGFQEDLTEIKKNF